MNTTLKVLGGIAYSSGVAGATAATYAQTKRIDYTPSKTSILNEQGELKEGVVLLPGQNIKINFQTENEKFTIMVFCPYSTNINPNREKCTSTNNMARMQLIKR